MNHIHPKYYQFEEDIWPCVVDLGDAKYQIIGENEDGTAEIAKIPKDGGTPSMLEPWVCYSGTHVTVKPQYVQIYLRRSRE